MPGTGLDAGEGAGSLKDAFPLTGRPSPSPSSCCSPEICVPGPRLPWGHDPTMEFEEYLRGSNPKGPLWICLSLQVLHRMVLAVSIWACRNALLTRKGCSEMDQNSCVSSLLSG